ncbi:hypothetical protein FD967_01570 [Polynucleobacter sp. JS-Mosq-20-D10]|uniref:hypothetical protein n=1 Tax=Polynucleobacter sp. JS-Mosq-20-D10 TaxID=2576922 RepID=UPI001BFDC230|nr:hypothetical protein [Polynucleobacter sp. JS-Mosq-20-D10]QWE00761.1 hypothetical protein FD967_01570 [Polynucleobacter sp. JS-Mosq-20-D10]
MGHLRNGIRKLLLDRQLLLADVTDNNKIAQFLESVRPINTNHDLVRVGGVADGGYLIPNDIENIGACFSPGVSTVADFENELTQRGIRCYLADYSVDKPPVDNPLFDFEKKYLGPKNNEIFMTLDTWVQLKAQTNDDLLLQMDIEESEYSVIFDTSTETLNKFRILVIEFHGLENLFNPMGFELINLTFTKLLNSFEVVHIHPNNCNQPIVSNGFSVPPVMEFTFLRKDRITQRTRSLNFPHPLDKSNVANKTDFPLPKCWY